jgi:hypothetical protein
MVVILVNWLIHPGKEEEFKAAWHKMTVPPGSGLYREILTTLDPTPSDPKFHSYSVGDPFYTTFINIGIWESLEHFDKAIGPKIPEAKLFEKDGRMKYSIEVEAYEFKLRERVVLSVVTDRGGALPCAAIEE